MPPVVISRTLHWNPHDMYVPHILPRTNIIISLNTINCMKS